MAKESISRFIKRSDKPIRRLPGIGLLQYAEGTLFENKNEKIVFSFCILLT